MYERIPNGWRFARESHLGIPISYATLDPRTGVLWACLDMEHWGPKLQRSKDLGETWEEVETPQYPETAEYQPGRPAKLDYLWVLEPGGLDQPERIYIGTVPGGLFVSDDGGDHFELVESLWNDPHRQGKWLGGGRDYPGIHSVLVDPRDSQHVQIGISCAGVLETTDGLKTWHYLNKGLRADFLPDPESGVGHDPHLLALCATAPDVLWQQNHCGIFRSTDGGRNWREVSETGGPARFGFPIAVDPQNPDIAWVVPATSDEQRVAYQGALCISRTEDGGKTWRAFRTGLPQIRCYDVVYRHALDLRGNYLAFGSTTGNVFYSDDRGENWQCLGNYFPPVYSVRFAEF